MTKNLNNKNVLISNNYFPKKFSKSSKKYRTVIGVGANIKNPITRFKRLVKYLHHDKELDLIKTSPILKNPPFGFLEQNDFYNACIVIKTDLEPLQLLKKLQYIEKRFGRKRTFKNAPRTLDLDIIFFENKRVYNDKLIIPHPKWSERESVIIPLTKLI